MLTKAVCFNPEDVYKRQVRQREGCGNQRLRYSKNVTQKSFAQDADRGRDIPEITTIFRRYAIMAKKVTGYIKLQIPAGKATPAPPVGPALGQHGVNIVQFTKEFNARTADKGDLIIPVVITVYNDRSFSFITKTPPAAVLLKKACSLKSGSAVPNKTKVATISKEEIQKIAEMKMPDLNAANIDAAISMIAGTCLLYTSRCV